MNLSNLKNSLQTQINAIVAASTSGTISSTDVGTLIMRETQHLINRLAVLEETPFHLVTDIDPTQLARYREFYREAIDHLLRHTTDCFTVVAVIEDLRMSEIKDKTTLEACLADIARRCDSVYKSGWTLTKEFFGYGERKWVDIWTEHCTGKTDHVHDRTMETAPQQTI